MMKRLITFFAVAFLLSTPAMLLVSCGDDDPVTEQTSPASDTSNDKNKSDDDSKKPSDDSSQNENVGWPANYGGVMLQGFYWDSYDDSNWAVLERQATELSQYFDLIWVPNSAYANSLSSNMGYHPVYWFDHKSAFGTEAQLRSMISTFREKGTGIIEDVVINHRASVDANWLNFPAEVYKGVTYQLTAADICQDDESKDNGYKPSGARDSGEGWGGARDLDHSGANVQKNVNAYLDFLLNDLGYTGFRYDFVKGFSGKYVGEYNKTAQPRFSVGECWDGNKTVVTSWINATKTDGVIRSAAFDFPMKYRLNAAFGSQQYNQLTQPMLANDVNYARYAVTFVDNHDTYREDSRLGSNVCAANAYILCMPGTPCLFLKHWQQNKGTLKRLIALRRAAGITNQSKMTLKATATGAVVTTQGVKGTVVLLLGSAQADTAKLHLAVEGKNFAAYADASVDLTTVMSVTDADAQPEERVTVTIPSFCTVVAGETCAFFESPASWGDTIMCWRWDNNYNYTGNQWPGANCTLLGTADNGRKVWKWTWDGKRTSASSPDSGIIFNNGSNAHQTSNLDFYNGGYYTEDGYFDTVKQ
jgi:alpha-amylase